MAVTGPVSLAMAGAGSRGSRFAGFAARFPGKAKVVAVADPREGPRLALAARHDVAASARFSDWRELARAPRLADAVVIATPDREHADAAVRFAALGYHILLEKPMAPTASECEAIISAVRASGVMLAVCHVLRYTSYTDMVRRVIENGELGELIGIEHTEPVGWWHFAHSYVRGNWSHAAESGPSILTKCCHDLDWLRYLAGRPAERVSSVGGLRHFTPANRPPGAGERCTDCDAEPGCPYSAVRLYLGMLADPARRDRWPLSVVVPGAVARDERSVLAALREGPYGRCAYSAGNDVADHQVVTVEFEGGLVATLTMSAFTPSARRLTRIMGSRGHLDGNGAALTLTDFVTGETRRLGAQAGTQAGPLGSLAGHDAAGGHDGGDDGVIDAFVHAVATGDTSRIRSSAADSLESHLMAFAAEESRQAGGLPVTMRTTHEST